MSVSSVRNMTCHPLNASAHMQSFKALADRPSYACIRSIKEMESSIRVPINRHRHCSSK